MAVSLYEAASGAILFGQKSRSEVHSRIIQLVKLSSDLVKLPAVQEQPVARIMEGMFRVNPVNRMHAQRLQEVFREAAEAEFAFLRDRADT